MVVGALTHSECTLPMRGLVLAYSVEKLEELKEKINGALASGRLNAWQVNFLTDIKGRINEFGRNVRHKQTAKLDEIVSQGRLGREKPRSSNVVSYSPRPQRRSYPNYRRRRFGRRFSTKFIVIAIFAVLMAGFSLFEKGIEFSGSSLVSAVSQPSSPTTVTKSNFTRNDFSITDGDTIRINGEGKGMRLVGFNTPETIEPRCAEERALGQQAKARLRQLVSKGRLSLERIQCSCKPGTQGTNACNYGRSCGVVRVDGRDVGDILISEGLAVPFVCGARSCPPTPRPWCA